MKKSIRRIVFIVLLITAASVFFGCSRNDDDWLNPDLTKEELRFDKNPITSRFSSLSGVNAVFWKGGTLGSPRAPGPSVYYIKGFVILSEEEKAKILNSYEFSKISAVFEKGMYPSITNFSEFEWTENENFTSDVLPELYGGSMGEEAK
ncbi:MAG: hypothetical protein LBQ91_02720 [Oscillospiraceae bacterium]|jgi:hypothetical protein|nr:hypothetical protein [Oscillospiraceae bacterium]